MLIYWTNRAEERIAQKEGEMSMDGKKLEEIANYYDTHELTEEQIEVMVPAEPVDQLMIVTSVRLPKPLMDKLRVRAAEQGVKPTTLMRLLIEDALSDADTALAANATLKTIEKLMHLAVREELRDAGLLAR